MLTLLSCLAKRDQVPGAIRCRCLLSKDVEIAVVGSNLMKDALWLIPLIEHGFDLILPSAEPEANGSFIGLSARVTFHN